MNHFQLMAALLGAIILLPGGMISGNAQTKETTVLTLEPIQPEVAPGYEVSFTGTLRTASGTGLADMAVLIVEQRPTESIILAEAVTGEDGRYSATWIAEIAQPDEDRAMTVLAIFDGQDIYSSSKSGTARLKVSVQKITASFILDKEIYLVEDVAMFTIKFFSSEGLLDPESISAFYNGGAVNMTRESKGIYTYRTPPLEVGRHTLEVTVEIQGYERFSQTETFKAVDLPKHVKMGEDFIPPASDVVLEGLYNEETNWYYGRFPVAIFNASDDDFNPSGLRHIMVEYMSKLGDERCTKNAVCYLQPGENMTLSRYNSVNHGEVILRWFAVDNTGNFEASHRLDLYVDVIPPSVSVLGISKESGESIGIGSHCDRYDPDQRSLSCVIIRAQTNEKVSFTIHASDLISGVESTYYRVAPYSSQLDEPWLEMEEGSEPFPRSISIMIPERGTYKLQLKVEDIAGNESPIKEFVIRVTEAPGKGFDLSIRDFAVTRKVDSSSGLYYAVSALLKNNRDDRIGGSAILLIQRADGVTSYINTMSIKVEPEGEYSIDMKWIPEQVGKYRVELFVWDDASKPLAPPAVFTSPY